MPELSHIDPRSAADALTVPAAAVGSDADGKFLYTITDNRFARLAIKSGLTDNGRIEVTAGLSEETPVIGPRGLGRWAKI